MKILLNFIVELILVPILVGWYVWKFPETLEPVIPWILWATFLHLTWKVLLDRGNVRAYFVGLAGKRKTFMIWLIVFVLGGSLSVAYLWLSQGSIKKLAEFANHEKKLQDSSSSKDETSRIEHLLAGVPDSGYRQLVASVIYAFDPYASLSVGNLVGTPDGTRTVDIELRSSGKDGAPLLTAIDVLDLPSGHKADITAVDVADSKRADIKADAIILCSNTGFEQNAISKAKRKNIGLISILRQGDTRVKTIIEEEIYLRKIDITPVNLTWNGEDFQNLNPDPEVLEYGGGSVLAWLQVRASLAAALNPEITFPITTTFNFKTPTDFYKKGKRIRLTSMAVSFTPRVQWLSQEVQIDAKTGIYDYVRNRLSLVGGPNSYMIKGIDFDHATPLSDSPPARAFGVGLRPGETELALADVHGGPMPGTKIAQLDELIRPEDLRLRLTPDELKKLIPNAEKTNN